MARNARTVMVHTVLWQVDDDHPQAGGGPAGDGSFTRRFRSKEDAEAFAVDKEYFGHPAEVDSSETPLHIAQRWGCA